MLRLQAHLIEHKLRETFTIARYSKDRQESLIVQLSAAGQSGYGECTSNAYYHFKTEEGYRLLLARKESIEAISQRHPSDVWIEFYKMFHDHPFVLCALDEAYWDLYGKKQGRTTRSILGLEDRGAPTSLTLSIGNHLETMRRMRASPWPIYKLKSSSDQTEEELSRIITDSPSPICIDANASWSPERTRRSIQEMDPEKVLFIEQPLAVGQDQSLLNYSSSSPIDLIADESAKTIEDIPHCVKHYSGVNIKLMKCGGITPAFEMIDRAKKLGLKIMIGCMAESSIGIGAAAQLISLADYIDLDGSLLISNDPADGPKWSEDGTIIWNDAMGNGVKNISL